jgi:hypothetical protein
MLGLAIGFALAAADQIGPGDKEYALALGAYRSCLLGETLKFDDGVSDPILVAKKITGCSLERAAALDAARGIGHGLVSQEEMAQGVVLAGRELREYAKRQKAGGASRP